MKRLKLNLLSLALLMVIGTVLVACSSDDSKEKVMHSEQEKSVINERNELAIEVQEAVISSMRVNEELSVLNKLRKTNNENYFEALKLKFENADTANSFITKENYKVISGDLYNESVYENFEAMEVLSSKILKLNLLTDEMTESEKINVIYGLVEKSFSYEDNNLSRAQGDYGTCKRRERNCAIMVTSVGIAAHIGCAATADISVLVTLGITTPVAVVCHAAAAGAMYAGYDNCGLDFRDCLKK